MGGVALQCCSQLFLSFSSLFPSKTTPENGKARKQKIRKQIKGRRPKSVVSVLLQSFLSEENPYREKVEGQASSWKKIASRRNEFVRS